MTRVCLYASVFRIGSRRKYWGRWGRRPLLQKSNEQTPWRRKAFRNVFDSWCVFRSPSILARICKHMQSVCDSFVKSKTKIICKLEHLHDSYSVGHQLHDKSHSLLNWTAIPVQSSPFRIGRAKTNEWQSLAKMGVQNTIDTRSSIAFGMRLTRTTNAFDWHHGHCC